MTARDAAQLQRSDEEQFAYAVTQHTALLTHNRTDFERLAEEYFVAGRTHYGLILAVRRPTYEIVRHLLIILNYVAADEIQDQIRYI
ncbi:MAG: DUF5615 family PIN-like protein [Chloroflexia bacterium]